MSEKRRIFEMEKKYHSPIRKVKKRRDHLLMIQKTLKESKEVDEK